MSRGFADHTEVSDWRSSFRSPLILWFAGTAFDGNRFPDQHVAERLSAHIPVLYVDPPISRFSARKLDYLSASLAAPRLRRIAEGLIRLTPVVQPGFTRPGMLWLTRTLVRGIVRRALTELGDPPIHATVLSTGYDFFGARGEQRRVLYATDDFAAGAELLGVGARVLRREQDRQRMKADLVIACSTVLAAKWSALGRDVALVPNGVDSGLFASVESSPAPADVDLPRPIAGFVGHLSHRIDVALLEHVARSGVSLLLVGPEQITVDMERFHRLFRRPNVRWVGPKPFEDLPSYLSITDVGLVPYATSDFNRSSFPLKTLEYLAAGRPVVATDLPSIRALETDLVHVASDPDGFTGLVKSVLRRPVEPGVAQARRDFAATHDWDKRARDFAGAIGVPVDHHERGTPCVA